MNRSLVHQLFGTLILTTSTITPVILVALIAEGLQRVGV